MVSSWPTVGCPPSSPRWPRWRSTARSSSPSPRRRRSPRGGCPSGWSTSLATTLVSVEGFDLRLIFLVALLVVAVVQLLITYLPYGRRLFAIGSNPDAARMAGLPMQRDDLPRLPGLRCAGRSGGLMDMAKFGIITVTRPAAWSWPSSPRSSSAGSTSSVVRARSSARSRRGARLDPGPEPRPLDGISDFERDSMPGLLILPARWPATVSSSRPHAEAWAAGARARRGEDGSTGRGARVDQRWIASPAWLSKHHRASSSRRPCARGRACSSCSCVVILLNTALTPTT